MRKLTPAILTKFLASPAATGLLPETYCLTMATAEDLPALLSLAARCFSTDVPDRRTLHYFITRAHAAFILLRQKKDNRIVGYSLVEANRRTQTLYVNTICVDPSAQGRGLGKFLCWLQTQLLHVSGYRTMTAHVAVDNDASLRLFTGQGFEIAEKIDNYYYDDGSSSYKIRLRSDAAA